MRAQGPGVACHCRNERRLTLCGRPQSSLRCHAGVLRVTEEPGSRTVGGTVKEPHRILN